MRRTALWMALVLTICSSASPAAVPTTMHYQGVLTDASGGAVPDGTYSITFKIYDSLSGGSVLWSETHLAVPVVGGIFEVVLGSSVPLNTLDFTSPYYLAISVEGNPETPRQPLLSTPYAMAAGNLSSPTARIRPTSEGGNLDLLDENGSEHSFLQADANGTGGYLWVGSTGLLGPGFAVDGNASGTGNPRVTISGGGQAVTFDMTQTGDGAVQLPVDAVDATETADEPGVASAVYPAAGEHWALATGIATNLLSRTIVAPDSGYVLAMASAQVELIADPSASVECIMGVSDAAGTFPANQDINLAVPPGSGSTVMNAAPHGLFRVGPGPNTFYLVGLKSTQAGIVQIYDMQLTLVYLPTSYGTVSPTFVSIPSENEEGTATRTASMDAAEVEAERAASVAANQARIERELARMRARIAELEARIQSDPQWTRRK